jgi:phage terminase large subunit
MTFDITTATEKLFRLTRRIRAAQGGTGAGKTIGILQVLIDLAQTDKTPKLTSIVSETMPHLRKGAMRDFRNILEDAGRWSDNDWNATDSIYKFRTGSQIEFFGADQSDKVRGPRRDRLFENECNNIPFETHEQLEVRTNDCVYLDWNPVTEFWFDEHLLGHDEVEHIVLTYRDNEALPKAIVESIERRRDRKGWWQVFGLGLYGEIEGKIYNGWKLDLDEVPHEATLERIGLDFGYTNDPSCAVAIYYYNGGYVLDELFYARGMSNKQIATNLLDMPQSALIIADSAEPKSIAELVDLKLNVIGVDKVKGETKDKSWKKWSIGTVQEQRISVTKRSVNVIKEYRNYMWETDRDGHVLNVPEHEYSHSMDAIAYAISHIVRQGRTIKQEYQQAAYEPQEYERPSGNTVGQGFGAAGITADAHGGKVDFGFNRVVDAPTHERREYE